MGDLQIKSLRTEIAEIRLEVAVDSMESLHAALQGGAERIELCASLAGGGITPSLGFVERAMEICEVPMHCMIRPRAGDFVYSEDEIAIMGRDIAACQRLEVPGVVLGLLSEDATIDVERTRRLVELARPMRVVFHRAIDVSVDISQSLEDIIACGVDEVLTSGGEASLTQGAARVAQMLKQAAGRIRVIGGAGVNADNAIGLWQATGVNTLHGTFRGSTRQAMTSGKPVMGEAEREMVRVTSRDEVFRISMALQRLRSRFSESQSSS